MAHYDDLIGRRFGKLLVLEKEGPANRQVYWRCKCDCGNISRAAGSALNRGTTNSCGCLRAEFNRLERTTHGMSQTLIYNVWRGMLSRCHNKNQKHYERYGGRGIYVCDEWRKSFERFYADMGPRPAGRKRYSIERDDNDGPYAPWNCRWATTDEQKLNKRPRKRKLTPRI